jgi:hypothetical protein
VQIIGPYLEDRTPIAFAELLEREFGGFVPHGSQRLTASKPDHAPQQIRTSTTAPGLGCVKTR